MTLMSSTRFGQFWTFRCLQDDLWFYWSLLQVLVVPIKSAWGSGEGGHVLQCNGTFFTAARGPSLLNWSPCGQIRATLIQGWTLQRRITALLINRLKQKLIWPWDILHFIFSPLFFCQAVYGYWDNPANMGVSNSLGLTFLSFCRGCGSFGLPCPACSCAVCASIQRRLSVRARMVSEVGKRLFLCCTLKQFRTKTHWKGISL